MGSAVDLCPLCGSTRGDPVLVVPYADIWYRLEAEWGATFPEDVRRRHQPAPSTTLFRCTACDLEFFSPIVPGDGEFYGRLTEAIGYHDDRWEFRIVAGLLPTGTDVVDFGCGRGAFLRSVAGRAGRAMGVDHNAGAVGELKEAGVEARVEDFATVAAAEPRAFDVSCAFHTLEHLPRADLLMVPAATCVRPGGRVFVSVPNRDRYARSELEPLDCPPHHVSRWAPKHFAILAERFGLELVAIRYEEPDLSHVRLLCRERAAARFPLLRALGSLPLRAYGRAAAGPLRYRRWARHGRFTGAGAYGHSVLAEFRVR